MGLKPTASKINYMLNEMLTLYRYNIFRGLSDPDKICSGLSKLPLMVQLIHVFTSVVLMVSILTAHLSRVPKQPETTCE